MAKYKVGDIVQIRDDLRLGGIYDSIDFAHGMKYLLGESVRIERVSDSFGDSCYQIRDENGMSNRRTWNLSELMIVGKSNSKNYIKE